MVKHELGFYLLRHIFWFCLAEYILFLKVHDRTHKVTTISLTVYVVDPKPIMTAHITYRTPAVDSHNKPLALDEIGEIDVTYPFTKVMVIIHDSDDVELSTIA